MASKWKILLSLLLVLIILAGAAGLFFMMPKFKKTEEVKKAIKADTTVLVLPLKRKDYRVRFSGYGMAKAARKTDVRAEISGLVVSISSKLKTGVEVTEKDLLVSVDERDLTESHKANEADYAKAQTELEKLHTRDLHAVSQLKLLDKTIIIAKRELSRLKRSNAATAAIDKQKLQIIELQGNVQDLKRERSVIKVEKKSMAKEIERLQALVNKSKYDLTKTKIYAPYSGYIEKVYVDKGSYVSPGDELFRIVDTNKIEVSITLGASHHNEVKKGAGVELKYYRNGATLWKGKVQRIAPTVDSDSRTFKVYCEIGSKEHKSPIPPGSTLLAYVDGNLYSNIFILPRIAFFEDKVFIARKTSNQAESIANERKPEIIRNLTDISLVKKGVEEGELLIYTNINEIANKSKIIAVIPKEHKKIQE